MMVVVNALFKPGSRRLLQDEPQAAVSFFQAPYWLEDIGIVKGVVAPVYPAGMSGSIALNRCEEPVISDVCLFAGSCTPSTTSVVPLPLQHDCFTLADNILAASTTTMYYANQENGCNYAASSGTCQAFICVQRTTWPPAWSPAVTASDLAIVVRGTTSLCAQQTPGGTDWHSGGNVTTSEYTVWLNNKNPNCCNAANYRCCSTDGWSNSPNFALALDVVSLPMVSPTMCYPKSPLPYLVTDRVCWHGCLPCLRHCFFVYNSKCPFECNVDQA